MEPRSPRTRRGLARSGAVPSEGSVSGQERFRGTRAKEFLRQRGVPFQERDVSLDRAAAEEVVRRSGQMAVPVITAGDDVIVGFDRPRLERLAQRAAADPATGLARPRLGLRVKDALGGVEVGTVHPDTPAERAGLRPGDLVQALDGQPIGSADDLERATERLRSGIPTEAHIRRDEARLRLRLTL